MGVLFFLAWLALAPAADAAADRKIDDLAAGGLHYCARFGDGRLKCFGINESGELGIEALERGPFREPHKLKFVDLGEKRRVKKLALGYYLSCAILDDDTLRCWGAFGFPDRGGIAWGKLPGQMGDNVPSFALDGKKPVDIVLASQGGCVLLDDDSVGCWDDDEILAHLLKDDRPKLRSLKFERRPEQLVAGRDFYCARFSDGKVTCFGGDNKLGQYGAGHNSPHTEAGLKPALLDDKAVQITAGKSHVCALVESGQVKCWGSSGYGTLGTETSESFGTTKEQMARLKAIDFGTDLPVRQVTCKEDHCCAVFENSAMKCWGDGMHGRLGNEDSLTRGNSRGTMGESLPWIDVGPLAAVRKAVVAAQSTCAVLEDDRMKCWGTLASRTNVYIGSEMGTMGVKLPFIKLWGDE